MGHPLFWRSRKVIATEATKKVLVDCGISVAARVIFVYLELNSGDGICSVGIRRLSSVLGIGKSTVSRSLIELRDSGYVTSEQVGNDRSIYTLVAKRMKLKDKKAAAPAYRSQQPLLMGLAICPQCSGVVDFEKDALVQPKIA